MTDDLGIGVVGEETLQQLCHGAFLHRRAGVGRSAVLVQTALVADADAVGVVALGMGTGGGLGAARIDGAVLGDVVVVARGGETTGFVTRLKVLDGEVTGDPGGGTVNDNKVYFTHRKKTRIFRGKKTRILGVGRQQEPLGLWTLARART